MPNEVIFVYVAWFIIAFSLLIASSCFFRLTPFFQGQRIQYVFFISGLLFLLWGLLELAISIYSVWKADYAFIQTYKTVNFIRLYCRVIFKTGFDLNLLWLLYKLKHAPEYERELLVKAMHIFGNLRRAVE